MKNQNYYTNLNNKKLKNRYTKIMLQTCRY